MSLASLVWISFTRNWLRTCFVVVAVIAAFGLFGALETIRFQRDAPPVDGDIVIVASDGMGALPVTYENDILALGTVQSAIGLSGIPVQNPESASQPTIITGVNGANLGATLPGMHISRELTARWLDQRSGAICDERTVRERGWRVNDHLSFALMAGQRTKSGTDQVELVLVGTYSNGSMLSGLVTHTDYLANLLPYRPTMGSIFVRPRDTRRALDLAVQIDALFQTQALPTRSAPISDYRQQAMRNASTVRLIIQGTLAVSFFTMVLIVANALAQSVRERTGEMALLHALGFQGRTVLFLVIAECVALLAVGAAVGLALAAGAFAFHFVDGTTESWMLPAHTIVYGGLVVLAGASLASLLPCWELARLPVADALRRL
jgi:putative ABC transport system permease protein